MAQKLTTKEFLEKLKERNPNVYNNYTLLSAYEGSSTYVYLQGQYGIHKVTPTNILNGWNLGIKNVLFREEYCQNRIHQNPRTRDIKILEVPSNLNNHVIIQNKYGIMKTYYRDLFDGFLPGIRAAVDKVEYLKKQIKEKYPKYTLLTNTYKSNQSPIIVKCNFHGEFKTTPLKITHCAGCPKCSAAIKGPGKNISNCERFKSKGLNTKCSVYIIKLYDQQEVFYKIGITVKSLDERLLRIPYTYEVVREIETNSYDAVYLERNLLRYHSKHSYSPVKLFDGKTECFSKICIK